MQRYLFSLRLEPDHDYLCERTYYHEKHKVHPDVQSVYFEQGKQTVFHFVAADRRYGFDTRDNHENHGQEKERKIDYDKVYDAERAVARRKQTKVLPRIVTEHAERHKSAAETRITAYPIATINEDVKNTLTALSSISARATCSNSPPAAFTVMKMPAINPTTNTAQKLITLFLLLRQKSFTMLTAVRKLVYFIPNFMPRKPRIFGRLTLFANLREFGAIYIKNRLFWNGKLTPWLIHVPV